MPSPKRADIDDFFASAPEAGRAHLLILRRLSLDALAATGRDDVEEKLAWNNPAYHLGGVRLWMLQAFKAHCSLRFPTHQFGPHRAEVEAAGYEDGEGFLKLPYDRPVPETLAAALIGYRLEEFERTGSTWNG